MLFKNFYSLQVSDLICKDSEYFELVHDILSNKNVLSMKEAEKSDSKTLLRGEPPMLRGARDQRYFAAWFGTTDVF